MLQAYRQHAAERAALDDSRELPAWIDEILKKVDLVFAEEKTSSDTRKCGSKFFLRTFSANGVYILFPVNSRETLRTFMDQRLADLFKNFFPGSCFLHFSWSD